MRGWVCEVLVAGYHLVVMNLITSDVFSSSYGNKLDDRLQGELLFR